MTALNKLVLGTLRKTSRSQNLSHVVN
uniref:Uncharacterized protein n=1 Tax=Anguilla anguilla TaxID=7936 RepID=A0A0E9TBV6_ANGAN